MAAPCELVVAMGRVGRDACAMTYQRVVVVWARAGPLANA
jgi:hypothetical protein